MIPVASDVLLFFFFFQAEDGIRDLTVTGVQTCALPIWRRRPHRVWVRSETPPTIGCHTIATTVPNDLRKLAAVPSFSRPTRSEERRVGKECRSRWSPYH